MILSICCEWYRVDLNHHFTFAICFLERFPNYSNLNCSCLVNWWLSKLQATPTIQEIFKINFIGLSLRRLQLYLVQLMWQNTSKKGNLPVNANMTKIFKTTERFLEASSIGIQKLANGLFTPKSSTTVDEWDF